MAGGAFEFKERRMEGLAHLHRFQHVPYLPVYNQHHTLVLLQY